MNVLNPSRPRRAAAFLLPGLVCLLVLTGSCGWAATLMLPDGRVITNCEVLDQSNLDDKDVSGRWAELIADPSWTVIRREGGLYGFKDMEVKVLEDSAALDLLPTPTPPPRHQTAPLDTVFTATDTAPAGSGDGITEIDTPMRVEDIMGMAYNVALNKRHRIREGGELGTGDSIRVPYNSRLRGNIADRITLGFDQGTRVAFNRVWRHIRVGTEYNLDLNLKQGELWIEVAQRLSNIDKVRLTVNGKQLLTTRPLLMHLQVTDNDVLEAAVFESKDLNIRFLVPGAEKAIPLRVGYRTPITPERAAFQNELDDEAIGPDEASTWKLWNSWEPQEIRLPQIEVRPEVNAKGLRDYIAALPADNPGRNPRAIRSVHYRSTFYALRQYRAGLQRYFDDIGQYPAANDAWTDALKENPGLAAWQGPYVERDLLADDVWGNRFVYETWTDQAGTSHADVRSAGANGIDEFGFGDDLR